VEEEKKGVWAVFLLYFFLEGGKKGVSMTHPVERSPQQEKSIPHLPWAEGGKGKRYILLDIPHESRRRGDGVEWSPGEGEKKKKKGGVSVFFERKKGGGGPSGPSATGKRKEEGKREKGLQASGKQAIATLWKKKEKEKSAFFIR